ncbi:MAG: rRNA cytosine-C5-methylase [Rubritepida sp.]|nr:rRNA cytosine-C5-methylase [Rubritepida sp.]
MSISPARRVASLLLEAVLEQHRALEEALDATPSAVEARDKAAGHRIAAAVLRRLGSLDAVMEPYLRRAPPPPALRALRIGAAELLLLGTPAHAAVASAVSLAPKPLAGLVNAVLRRVSETGATTLAEVDGERLDTPAWLWTAWHAAHGSAVRAIAAAHRIEAPLDLTLRPGASAPEGAVMLPTGTARLPAGTRITELPGFSEGDFWAQDAAAAIPAMLLNVQPGERVADLCAAPGGKTAQLASMGANVVAVEREGTRMVRLRENMVRLKLTAELVNADVIGWKPEGLFDAILLDAPCTATGTIRRHPDVPHLKRQKDVAVLAAQQRNLLAAAAKLLRPGGRMVFATCSLQAEEGEAHLAHLPEGLRLDPIRDEEVPGIGATEAGTLRTRPDLWADQGGMDGFFAMRLIRD